MTQEGLRCVIYRRVSHDNQREADGGKSLRMQLEKGKSWIALNNAELVDVFTDEAISAKSIKGRAGFQKALKMVYSDQADALIIYSLSRGFRSTQDALHVFEELNRRGKVLVSLTEQIQSDSAMSKFYLTLLSSLAELERNLLAERVQAVMDNKRANGERLGTIPYGFSLSEDGVHLVEEPEEQKIVRSIQRYKKQGYSLNKIAQTLTKRGIPTRTNGRWYHTQVKCILNRVT